MSPNSVSILPGQITSQKNPFLSILQKDDAATRNSAAEYLSYWEDDENEPGKVSQGEIKDPKAHPMVNKYYDVVAELYEQGWGQSFHFCRFLPGEPFRQAIARYEHVLALKLGLKKGMRVLDVGCGIGGPAREIAAFSDCEVTGINNHAYQVKRARQLTREAGMANQVQFIKGDFNKLPFADGYFDAIYAIEATVHAESLVSVYSEIFRVLKPGGSFALYEWLMTSKYRPESALHRSIKHGIEFGDAIPQLFTTAEAVAAMKTVGFQVTFAEDMADKGDIVPWWHSLAPRWNYIRTFSETLTLFRISRMGRLAFIGLLRCLEAVRLAPGGTVAGAKTIEVAAVSLTEGGQHGIFTPMYLMVGHKAEHSHVSSIA